MHSFHVQFVSTCAEVYDDDEFITDAKHTVDDRENTMSAEAAAAAAKEAAAKREEEKKLELEEARRNYKPSAGPVELAFGTIIVVYIVVFFIGMQRNKTKANAWLETFRPLLESQFAVLGDSSSTESKVTFLFTFFLHCHFLSSLFLLLFFLFIIVFFHYLLFHFLLSPLHFICSLLFAIVFHLFLHAIQCNMCVESFSRYVLNATGRRNCVGARFALDVWTCLC